MPTVNMAARMHQKCFFKRALGFIKKRNYPSSCGIISFKYCRSPGTLGSGKIPYGSHEMVLVINALCSDSTAFDG